MEMHFRVKFVHPFVSWAVVMREYPGRHEGFLWVFPFEGGVMKRLDGHAIWYLDRYWKGPMVGDEEGFYDDEAAAVDGLRAWAVRMDPNFEEVGWEALMAAYGGMLGEGMEALMARWRAAVLDERQLERAYEGMLRVLLWGGWEGLAGRRAEVEEIWESVLGRLHGLDAACDKAGKREWLRMVLRLSAMAEASGTAGMCLLARSALREWVDGRSMDAYDALRHAVALRNAGLHAEALEVAEALVELAPKAESTWMVRGDSLEELGRWEEALAAYSAGVNLSQESPYPLLSRGILFLQMGQAKKAVHDLSRCLKRDVDNESALSHRAYAYWDLGQLDAALADAVRVCELGPTCAAHWGTKAEILGAMGDEDGFYAALERCLSLNAGEAELLDRRTVLMYGEEERFRVLVEGARRG